MGHYRNVLELHSAFPAVDRLYYAETYNDLRCGSCRPRTVRRGHCRLPKALEIEPDYAEAYNDLGFALAGCGRIDDAIGQYKQALHIQPNYAKAHYDLGVALTGRGRIDEAIGHYQRALQIEPDYVDVLNNLGNALRRGRIDEAIADYQRALSEFQPDNAAAHYNLGLALAGCGRIDEAIGHYQRALEIKPDYIDVLNNLAVACVRPIRKPCSATQRRWSSWPNGQTDFPAARRRKSSIRSPPPMPRREGFPRLRKQSARGPSWPGNRRKRPC